MALDFSPKTLVYHYYQDKLRTKTITWPKPLHSPRHAQLANLIPFPLLFLFNSVTLAYFLFLPPAKYLHLLFPSQRRLLISTSLFHSFFTSQFNCPFFIFQQLTMFLEKSLIQILLLYAYTVLYTIQHSTYLSHDFIFYYTFINLQMSSYLKYQRQLIFSHSVLFETLPLLGLQNPTCSFSPLGYWALLHLF